MVGYFVFDKPLSELCSRLTTYVHLLRSGSSISFISFSPSCKLSSAKGRKCSCPRVLANTPNVSGANNRLEIELNT